MSATKPRQNLGRGLDALFGESATEAPVTVNAPSVQPSNSDTNQQVSDVATAQDTAASSAVPVPKAGLTELPVEHMAPSRLQPRRVFDQAQIDELAASVRDKGVLQPLLVREAPDGTYEIIAGERRWRAAQKAQVHQVPVIIKDFTDTEVLEVALVENLQRADLTPLEEAEGYQRLMGEFGHTQEALANLMGKSRAHVANMLRLLGLPGMVKDLIDEGKLSMGHARALVGVADAGYLAKQVVAKGLSVRQVEKLVKKHGKAGRKAKDSKPAQIGGAKDADTKALENQLEEALGLSVDIAFDGKGGTLTLLYSDLEQLDDVIARLMVARKSPRLAGGAGLDRDPNVLDIEEVLAKRSGAFQPDHSLDAAASEPHVDSRQDDIGSEGGLGGTDQGEK